MKIAIIVIGLLIILWVVSIGLPCDKVNLYEGVCTVEIQPESDTTPSVKPSNEKPPRNLTPDYSHTVDIKPESTVDDEINAAKAEDARLAGQGKKPQ